LNTSSRAFAYDSDTGYLTYYSSNAQKTYHLTCTGGIFRNETEAAAGSVITLFKKSVAPTGITLADATVAVGETVALKPVLEPAGAAGTITWGGDERRRIASVDENGVVTGLAAGRQPATRPHESVKRLLCDLPAPSTAPEKHRVPYVSRITPTSALHPPNTRESCWTTRPYISGFVAPTLWN
jgi:hypothetical protein